MTQFDPVTNGGRVDAASSAAREYARRLADALHEGGAQVRLDEPLRAHTTLQIGGPSSVWVEARTAEAVTAALATAHEMKLPLLVVGGGSNLLASDSGWSGVAVHVAGSRTHFGDGECTVEAGADFLEFIFACRDRSLTALEFAAGIPGSIGGAIYGNAGCYGKSIGDFVIEGEVCAPDGSNRRWEPAEFFEFAYRDSRLKRDPHVILAARLRVVPGSLESIQAEIDLRLGERKVKHPDWRTEPTAGSYFKNLPPERPGEHRVPAGKILDQLDCRGLRVGDALVFPKHANIIVNAGRASAREVLTLAEVMRTRALRAFNVRLEEEVMFVGERPPLLPHEELADAPS